MPAAAIRLRSCPSIVSRAASWPATSVVRRPASSECGRSERKRRWRSSSARASSAETAGAASAVGGSSWRRMRRTRPAIQRTIARSASPIAAVTPRAVGSKATVSSARTCSSVRVPTPSRRVSYSSRSLSEIAAAAPSRSPLRRSIPFRSCDQRPLSASISSRSEAGKPAPVDSASASDSARSASSVSAATASNRGRSVAICVRSASASVRARSSCSCRTSTRRSSNSRAVRAARARASSPAASSACARVRCCLARGSSAVRAASEPIRDSTLFRLLIARAAETSRPAESARAATASPI